MHIEVSGWSGLAVPLNTMALLIALGGAWLLLATRWRQQLARDAAFVAGTRPAVVAGTRLANRSVDRFFYTFGSASLGLAWLLSEFTRLL